MANEEEKKCTEAGAYRCTICRNTVTLTKDLTFPTCSRCGANHWILNRKA